MAKQNKKTPKKQESHGAAIGVGLTTAAVAAAGAYFLYGSKSAAKNRKMVQSWALKAKAEVLEKLEDAKEMTQDEYEELVHSVAKAYSSAKTASQKDIKAFAAEMTDHWKQIEKAAKPLTSNAKRKVKKVAKQVKKSASKQASKTVKKAKKVTKKAAKKTAKKK